MTGMAGRSNPTLTPIGGDIKALINKLLNSNSDLARKAGQRLSELQSMPAKEIARLREERETIEKKFFHRARHEMLINNSRLMGLDRDRTLANYKPNCLTGQTMKKQLKEALDLWPEEKRSFYIWGPDNGPGKSHCAKGFLIELIKRGVDVRFWRMTDFRGALIRCYKDTELINPAEECINIEYLVLDDWDKAGVTQEKNPGLFSDIWSLVDYRCDQNLPIILTGQHPLYKQAGFASSLEELWGKDIANRLSSCIQLYVTGTSGRGNAAGREE